MELEEIQPGLRYWTAPHPSWNGATDWPEDVNCVSYDADALVLIDPLLPRGEEESFVDALDRYLELLERPVAVLLTAPWHRRDSALIAERYDTIVWTHPAGRARLPFETRSGRLPDGIEAFSPEGVSEGEVAFYLRPHRALVVAEFLMGIDGGLRVLPSPALQDQAVFEKSLRSLLAWPIDHVLVSHGEPVIGGGGGRRIDEALQAFAASV